MIWLILIVLLAVLINKVSVLRLSQDEWDDRRRLNRDFIRFIILFSAGAFCVWLFFHSVTQL